MKLFQFITAVNTLALLLYQPASLCSSAACSIEFNNLGRMLNNCECLSDVMWAQNSQYRVTECITRSGLFSENFQVSEL